MFRQQTEILFVVAAESSLGNKRGIIYLIGFSCIIILYVPIILILYYFHIADIETLYGKTCSVRRCQESSLKE